MHTAGAVATRRSTWIKVTSRMGVWGLIVATTPALVELAGARMGSTMVRVLGAGGLLASGLGVALASALVLRALPAGIRPLKLAAIAGIPFGIALMMGGAAVIQPLGAFADAVDAAGPLVLAIGIVVVVLLVVGFVRSLARTRDE